MLFFVRWGWGTTATNRVPGLQTVQLREQFVHDYKEGYITMATHPLMRRFSDTRVL